jgi:hypothetical protein
MSELDPAAATPEEEARWAEEEAAAALQEVKRLELSAKDIIEADSVLDLFEDAWRQVMAGEERNAKVLYLATTTRLFDTCMSAAIKGPSSAGKSAVRKKVLEFVPPEDVISFTTMSEKALLWYQDDFTGKILSMGEATASDEKSLQDYLLRELISEGKLRYPVSQKIGSTVTTIIIEKNGPVVFLVTTTKAALHPENETRMLSLEIDDSDSQTVSVLDKIAMVVGENVSSSAVNFEPWRDYQRWLAAGNRKVKVPFARELAALIPPRAVRLRRDFPQLLLAIKAHALLHRHRRPVNDGDEIVADVEHDYEAVYRLLHDLMAEGAGTAVRVGLQETVEAVKQATACLPADEGATAQAVGKLLHLDKSSARRRLVAGVNEGFLINMEVRRGQPGKYRLSGEVVDVEAILPTPSYLLKVAPPCHRKANPEQHQKDNRGKSGGNPVAGGNGSGGGGNSSGKASATDKPLNGNDKEGRWHGGSDFGGDGAGKDFPGDRAGKDFPDMPDFLKRTQPCPSCDGSGCPWCQPERHGLPRRK